MFLNRFPCQRRNGPCGSSRKFQAARQITKNRRSHVPDALRHAMPHRRAGTHQTRQTALKHDGPRIRSAPRRSRGAVRCVRGTQTGQRDEHEKRGGRLGRLFIHALASHYGELVSAPGRVGTAFSAARGVAVIITPVARRVVGALPGGPGPRRSDRGRDVNRAGRGVSGTEVVVMRNVHRLRLSGFRPT
jgi:hypothetical protein